jgi:mannose-6-phosphate isomerase
MTKKLQLKRPLFFQPNRVWRCYTGGMLLDQFVGNPNPKDDYFPEDWLASTTLAHNGEHQQHPDEGLARIRMPDGSAGPLFKDILPEGIDVLCKFLDSSVRLPIQCHPDKAFAKKYYHSDHGKAESWLVLATRYIDKKPPYLLMGFKPDVDKQKFINAVKKQDIATMESMLHKIPVSAGEAYFIPGRFPHAIGPGVMMLEVQEPSDWVVQPEKVCAGTQLADSDMWGPLDPKIAMECFDYRGGTKEAMLERLMMHPSTLQQRENALLERIIGPKTTDCFIVDRLTIDSGTTFALTTAAQYIAIVTAGHGEIMTATDTDHIKRGNCFFVSDQIPTVNYVAEEQLEVYVISR